MCPTALIPELSGTLLRHTTSVKERELTVENAEIPRVPTQLLSQQKRRLRAFWLMNPMICFDKLNLAIITCPFGSGYQDSTKRAEVTLELSINNPWTIFFALNFHQILLTDLV
jgi:hypothetical protein